MHTEAAKLTVVQLVGLDDLHCVVRYAAALDLRGTRVIRVWGGGGSQDTTTSHVQKLEGSRVCRRLPVSVNQQSG